jgi:hypothetical protein
MVFAQASARKGVEAGSSKGDWFIIAGYGAAAALTMILCYLANAPGTAISDLASMSVFP